MLDLVNNLCARIENKWRKLDHSVYQFPEVVMEELDASALLEAFKFTHIDELLKRPEMKNIQISSEFSELHLKLFDNGKFYVELLNWWDRDTSIHDHGFSGVLVQLGGSALNVIYSYEQKEVKSQWLKLGETQLEKAFISRRGDVHIIPCGDVEKHAVLHLEQPTTSLIIRTHSVTEVSPQLNYFPPHVLVDHSATDLVFGKRLKYFRMLRHTAPELFREQVTSFLSEASPTESFWMVLKLADLLFSKEYVSLLQGFMNSCDSDSTRGLRAKLLKSAAARYYSQTLIERMKTKFSNPSDRLLIAVLAASYSPGDYTTLARYVGISETRDEAVSKIRALVPNELRDQYDLACRSILVSERA